MSFAQGLFGPPNIEKLKAKRDLKGLVKAIGYKGDARVRKAAVTALSETGGAQALEPLSIALQDPDQEVRLAAVEALGTIQDTRAVDVLTILLKDTDKDVRRTTAEALAKIKDVRALEPLIAVLQDASGEVRLSAVVALGEIGDVRAVEHLVVLLNDKSLKVPVTKVLDKLNWQPDQSSIGANYWIAKGNWDQCIAIGAPAVQALIAAFKDDTYGVTSKATATLGKIGSPAVRPLLEALDDTHEVVRTSAARALGEIGDVQAIESLVKTLSDTRSKVRQATSQALGRLGWQPDRDATGAAFWIGMSEWDRAIEIGASAIEPIIATLRTSSESDYDFRCIAEALLKISDPKCIELLVSALKSEPFKVRKVVAATLDKLGWQPDQSDAGAAYWIVQGQWDKCDEFGALATGVLVAALAYWDKDVRQPAVQALDKLNWQPDQNNTEDNYRTAVAEYWIVKGEFGQCTEIGSPAVKPLIAALRDDDFSRRSSAAKALGIIGDMQAVGPLIGILEWQDERQRQLVEIGPDNFSRILHDQFDIRAVTVGLEIMHGTEIKSLCDVTSDALKLITGQDFGQDVTRWKQWQKESRV